MKRGQYIRLLLATAANPTAVIAAAKQMSLHGSATVEDSSTKDTTGDYTEQEVTGLSYDITGNAQLLTSNDPLATGANTAGGMLAKLQDTPLYWRICIMEGDNNRTIVSTICSGQAKLTQWSLQGQNKQVATFNYTLTGFGPIVPGGATTQSAPASSGND